MVCISKPLQYLTTVNGQVVWKEERAKRFPKMRKRWIVTPFFVFFGSPFVVMLLLTYGNAQSLFNPNSWPARKMKELEGYMYSLKDTQQTAIIRPHQLRLEDVKSTNTSAATAASNDIITETGNNNNITGFEPTQINVGRRSLFARSEPKTPEQQEIDQYFRESRAYRSPRADRMWRMRSKEIH